MIDNNSFEKFKEEFNTLNKNVEQVFEEVDSKLKEILMEISLEVSRENIKNNDKFLSLLTKEIEYMNAKYQNIKQNNIVIIDKKTRWKSWLDAVSVILESIGKYFNIPLLDIFNEILKIGSTFLPADRNGVI